ncbi:hypothetical protein AWT69_001646 [Pseudomonas putida]|nr:hypothetical protein AWT69_001646 [Pseudomonas putida]
MTPGHYGVFSKLKFLNSFIGKFSSEHVKGYAKGRVGEALAMRRRYRVMLGAGTGLLVLLALIVSLLLL